MSTSAVKGENEEESMCPDGGFGWVVVVASFMCSLVVDGSANVFGILLEPLKSHYEVSVLYTYNTV